MKLKKNTFCLLLAIACIVIACKKDSSSKQSDLPPIYLSKIYYLRGSGTVIDTIGNYFGYDNMKRVSYLVTTYLYGYNGVFTKHLDTTRFSYYGSDNLPYRSFRINRNPYTTDTILQYYFYSPEGKVIKDSSLSFKHPVTGSSVQVKTIQLYTYSNNIIYKQKSSLISTNPNNLELQYDTMTLDVNNNIILKHTSKNISVPGSVLVSEYMYGNNPSPFVNINFWDKLVYTYEDQEFYLKQGTKNNLISFKNFSYQNGVLQAIQTNIDNSNLYTFQSNNYPISLSALPPNHPDTKKLIYVYKGLQ